MKFQAAISLDDALGLGINACLLPEEIERKLFTAPQKTAENRSMHGIVIRDGELRVYIEDGIHASERGGPGHVVYFLADLLQATTRVLVSNMATRRINTTMFAWPCLLVSSPCLSSTLTALLTIRRPATAGEEP